MLVVFTGNGKGKTTAALGQAIRAAGQGKRAVIFQFVKGPWRAGEHKFFAKHPNLRIKIYCGGKGFVGILGDKLPRVVHQQAALKTLQKASQALSSGKWDIVVLDEVNVAVSLKLIKASDVLKVIEKKPQGVAVILTGRNAPKSFIKKADLVTEMKKIKHPYSKGQTAQIGFEF